MRPGGLRGAAVVAAGLLGLALATALAAAEPTIETVDELLEQASQQADAGDFDEAQTLAAQAVRDAERVGDPLTLGAALQAHASAHTRRNRYAQAEAALMRALEVLTPLGPTVALVYTQEELAKIYRLQADYVTALEWLRRALRSLEPLDDKLLTIDTYQAFGSVYDLMGDLEKSLRWSHKALALARAENDTRGIANALYAVAESHKVLGEYEMALANFRDALALDERTGVVRNIAYSHVKVGYMLLLLARYEESRPHLTQARTLFTQLDTPRDLHWAVIDIARLDIAEGHLDAAREPLESALARALEAPWPRLIVMARIALADLAEREERYDDAADHLNLALQDAQAQQEMHRVVELYTRQARVLALAGQPTLALEALQARVALEQQLFDVRRTSVLAALQGEVEFERQAERLRVAEQEEALARLELEREATLRILWVGAVLVLCALSFLVYGRLVAQRQTKRLSAEVAQKTSALRERHAELERAYAAVDRASLTDAMTGLANRRFLERHIEADAARALRLHEDARLAGEVPTSADLVFFLVDLDHFKTINDQQGHAAGDAVLVEVSRRLERVFRQGDFVVRWGGEEFLLVARFVDRQGAAAIAERIRRAVADTPFSLAEGSVRCTCSIGFSAYPLQADRPAACAWEDVMAIADQALYTVKRGARDGWVGYLTARDVPSTTPIAQWVPRVVSGGAIEAVVSEGVQLREAEPDASS